jgi:hypothetical protein
VADNVKTQGTHVYFVNPTGPALVKLECPTGVTGVGGGDVDQIEDTCLDETEEHTYVDGLATRESLSIPFNMRPAAASHQLLWDLKESRELLPWLILLSESADPPTLAAGPTPPAGTMVPPATRTALAFDGVVTNVAIDLTNNDIVRGTLTVQRRSKITPTWFEPA